MNRDDQLWELLGKAKRPPTASPFFARNVLRAIREEQASAQRGRGGFIRWFRRWTSRLAVAGICLAATLLTVLPSANSRRHPPENLPSATRQVVAGSDYEVIKHLDELVADEESSVWLDDSVN